MATLTATSNSNLQSKLRNAGPQKPKRVFKVTTLADRKPSDSFAKIAVVGFGGAGKTFLSIIGALEAGLSVFVINGDFGGDGLTTVSNYLRNNRPELARNVFLLKDDGLEPEDIEDFLDDPVPTLEAAGLYDRKEVLIVWEGFSSFQAFDKLEQIENDTPDDTNNAFAKWGTLRKQTVSLVEKFMAIHNIKTGEKWHKCIVLHLTTKQIQKEVNGKYVTVNVVEPLLGGAAKKILPNALDLIVNVGKFNLNGSVAREYLVDELNENESFKSKIRGYQFSKDVLKPGNAGKFWRELITQTTSPVIPETQTT